MPINYARRLTDRKRTKRANRQLGLSLAFVAGAANAGGFLAVQQYTSHMTGIASSMAGNLALGSTELALGGLGGLLSFIAGAITSTLLVNFSRRRRLHGQYALPLLLEALLLLCFGVLGTRLMEIPGFYIPLTVMLLCFIMGLQNALITKISKAEIRTTHLTGTITDIGVELGKLFYWNMHERPDRPRVLADRSRLKLLSLLLLAFFAGGVSGALGFKHAGYLSTVPLALILTGLALVPMLDDVGAVLRRLRKRGA